MKKAFCLLLCVFFCIGTLAACLPGLPAAVSFSALPESLAMADSGAMASSLPLPAPGSAGSLRVLLPQNSDVLATILTRQAEAEGIALTVQQASGAEAYASQAMAALAETGAPDIFLLQDNSEAQVLGAWMLEDLAGAESPAPLATLAEMTPAQSRLLEEQKVYGLPLGTRAEGYLVDIDMLAALLGTKNTAQLLTDLQKASWEQWSQMLAALEIYLERPAVMRVPLGDNAYITPAYRPEIAQPLRGIFAFADGTAAAVGQSALDAALYAPYASPEDWLNASEEETRELLFPSLEALYALMDFETLHMARPEGAVYRGEDYLLHSPLTEEEAATLFGEGTALLYRADTQKGFALQQTHARLEGRLALLPVKLPPPVLAAEEENADGEAGEDPVDSSGSAASTGASSTAENAETPEEEEAEKTAAERVAAGIEAHNSQYWYNIAGYLCVNMQSQNKEAARALLLRLFTTQAGTEAIQNELHLQPFSQLLPQSGLGTQLAAIDAGQSGQMLPAPAAILHSAQERIGAHISTQLMGLAEWGEDEAYNFLVGSLEALGYSLNTIVE